MSDSSDSEFEGFPDASVDDVVSRQNVPDSDISLGEDSSDEEGDNGASVGDAAALKRFPSGCQTSIFRSSRNRLVRDTRCCQVPRSYRF